MKTIIDEMEEQHLEDFVNVLETAFASVRTIIAERVTEMVATGVVASGAPQWHED